VVNLVVYEGGSSAGRHTPEGVEAF
jgi:hypothetical protein